MTDVRQSDFVEKVEAAWSDWEGLLSRLRDEGLEQFASSGSWTLGDIVAHICWHEREMVGLLARREFAGSPLWDLPTDERNAIIWHEYKGRPIDDITAEASKVHERLMGHLASMTDKDLNDPSSFPGMPFEWAPWQVIASNTYEHYDDHAARIRARLAARG